MAAAEGVIFNYFMMARFVGAVEWHEGLHPFLEEAKKNQDRNEASNYRDNSNIHIT